MLSSRLLLRLRASHSCSPCRFPVRSYTHRFHRNVPVRTAATTTDQATRPSFLYRAATFTGSALLFTCLGFAIAAAPALETVRSLWSPPSDAETLRMWEPADDDTRDKETYLNTHPLVVSLRADPDFVESRPHLKMPPAWRSHSLTAGTLFGPGKMAVPPLGFTEKAGGPRYVQILHAGSNLCGHPGIVHGGFLATVLDEGLWRCCFDEEGRNMHMTAKLEIDYKAPTLADQFLVLRGTRTKAERRKAWVEGQIETLPNEGETPVVLARATALYVTPRNVSWLAKAYTWKSANTSAQRPSKE